MLPSRSRTTLAVTAVLALGLAACGSDDDSADATTADTAAETDGESVESETSDVSIVVTTNILGDVVGELIDDQAEVITVMPVGADPHDFQASAQEINRMLEADALIVNGADFEEGLLDVIESAIGDGVPTYEAITEVETLEFGDSDHDHSEHEAEEDDHDHEDEDEDHADEAEEDDHDHEDEDHADEAEEDDHDHEDEDHADEAEEDDHDHEDEDEDHANEAEEDDHDHEHDHEGVDPHFFTDPTRMAAAVDGIVDFLLTEVPGLDADLLAASAAEYTAELDALDHDVEELVDGIADDSRILVTSHEVFGYFANQYGFEIVGVVVPGGSTTDAASAGEIAALAEVIEQEGVPAIFTDSSSSPELAETLAAEVGDVELVALFSESLGDADSEGATYLEMVRTNAERIAAALS